MCMLLDQAVMALTSCLACVCVSVGGGGHAGATITVVDNGYTPGGAVTNGFDIQTPSAVHDGTTALSSDYTRVDGTVFTGAKGACTPTKYKHTRSHGGGVRLLLVVCSVCVCLKGAGGGTGGTGLAFV